MAFSLEVPVYGAFRLERRRSWPSLLLLVGGAVIPPGVISPSEGVVAVSISIASVESDEGGREEFADCCSCCCFLSSWYRDWFAAMMLDL